MRGFSLTILEYQALIAPNIDFSRDFKRFNNLLADIQSKDSSDIRMDVNALDSSKNNAPFLANLESFKQDFSLSHIPLLERRRLNNAAKCIFSLLPRFTFKELPLLVFSSCKGEINRCFEMFYNLKYDDLLSPSAFSLSVLNATPALIAIGTHNDKEISAISGNPSLEYALINAYIKLLDSSEKLDFSTKDALVISYYEKLDLDNKKPSVFYLLSLRVTLQSNSGIQAVIKYKSNADNVDSKIVKKCANAPQILSDLYFLSALEKCKTSSKATYCFNDGTIEWNYCLQDSKLLDEKHIKDMKGFNQKHTTHTKALAKSSEGQNEYRFA